MKTGGLRIPRATSRKLGSGRIYQLMAAGELVWTFGSRQRCVKLDAGLRCAGPVEQMGVRVIVLDEGEGLLLMTLGARARS